MSLKNVSLSKRSQKPKTTRGMVPFVGQAVKGNIWGKNPKRSWIILVLPASAPAHSSTCPDKRVQRERFDTDRKKAMWQKQNQRAMLGYSLIEKEALSQEITLNRVPLKWPLSWQQLKWTSDLWPLECCDNTLSCISHYLCGHLLQQLSGPNTVRNKQKLFADYIRSPSRLMTWRVHWLSCLSVRFL